MGDILGVFREAGDAVIGQGHSQHSGVVKTLEGDFAPFHACGMIDTDVDSQRRHHNQHHHVFVRGFERTDIETATC